MIVTFMAIHLIGVILAVAVAGLLAHSIDGRDETAEEEVLHDGELAEDLGDEHPPHAAVDLGPGFGGRDVIEHGAVPAQSLDSLCAVDEADLVEVEELLSEFFES